MFIIYGPNIIDRVDDIYNVCYDIILTILLLIYILCCISHAQIITTYLLSDCKDHYDSK